MCRGCCCGTAAKHPDTDHEAHAERLASAVSPAAKLWVVDCLGPCERSNVVVIRSGGRRRWFGDLLTDESLGALAGWLSTGASHDPPSAVAGHEFDPGSVPMLGALHELSWSADEIADVVADALRAEGGSWSMGVDGALAEYRVGDEPHELRRHGRTLVSATPRGALRLHIGGTVRAFVAVDSTAASPDTIVLATPRRPRGRRRADGPPAVRVLGPDTAAVHPDRHGRDVLTDLGASELTRFCVRTGADDELTVRLAAAEGTSLVDLLGGVGHDLVRRSPHRIVETTIGRIEVFAPIPPVGGTSPEGPHTHLLPDRVVTTHTDPRHHPQDGLPPGWVAGATFHPGPGWQPDTSLQHPD